MALTVRSHYMNNAANPKLLRESASTALKGIDFDTLIGTGISGVMPLALLADYFGVNYAAVRKSTEASHSDVDIKGTIGAKWLFLDDFIASGSTFNRCYQAVHNVCEEREHVTECVGAFEYERLEGIQYHSLAYVKREHFAVQKLVDRLDNPEPPTPKPKNVVDGIGFDSECLSTQITSGGGYSYGGTDDGWRGLMMQSMPIIDYKNTPITLIGGCNGT